MGDALKSLEAQYLLLTQNLADILAACQTDEQRSQVRANYVAARRNYWDAINQVFHDDDPKIEQAVTQMHAAQISLQKMTQDLANISKVINEITTAVKMGTELASMAG
jgi:ActR/RegA family two-component response regulator